MKCERCGLDVHCADCHACKAPPPIRLHRDDMIALMATVIHSADQIAKNSEMELPEHYVDWATGIYDAAYARKS